MVGTYSGDMEGIAAQLCCNRHQKNMELQDNQNCQFTVVKNTERKKFNFLNKIKVKAKYFSCGLWMDTENVAILFFDKKRAKELQFCQNR